MTTEAEKLEAHFQAQLAEAKWREERHIDAESVALAVIAYRALKELSHYFHNRVGDISKAELLAALEQARMETGPVKRAIAAKVAEASGKAYTRATVTAFTTISFNGKVAGIHKADEGLDAMTEYFRSLPVGGYVLEEWVNKTFDLPTIDKIRNEVERGLVDYRHGKQVSKALLDSIPATRTQIDTLVRTYLHTAMTEGLKRTYEANRDVIRGVRWSAARDPRTCLVCASLDDRQFGLDNHPPCPVHARCRCVLSPIADYRSLGTEPPFKDIREMAKTPTVLQWAKANPKRMETMLGPSRYRLFKAGLVGIEDLVDWGTYTIKPLRDLLPGQDVKKVLAELKKQ